MSQKFPNLAAHKQTNLNLRTQGAAGYIPVDPFKPSIAFSLNNFPSWFLKGRVRNNEDESEQHSIKVDDPENGYDFECHMYGLFSFSLKAMYLYLHLYLQFRIQTDGEAEFILVFQGTRHQPGNPPRFTSNTPQ